MKVRDIYNSIMTGELRSLSVSEIPLEEFDHKQKTRLITFINDSLRDLYSRYIILEKSVMIESLSHKSKYLLDKRFAKMNRESDVEDYSKYIYDTPGYEFNNDVLKIIAVYNQVGNKLPLNDAQQWASVFTSKSNELQLTHPLDGQMFEVVYQASHPILEVKENIDQMMDQEVEIPFPLLDALLANISYRYFNSMSGQTFSNKSQELLMRYEGILDNIEFTNSIHTSDINTNVKLMLRGYP